MQRVRMGWGALGWRALGWGALAWGLLAACGGGGNDSGSSGPDDDDGSGAGVTSNGSGASGAGGGATGGSTASGGSGGSGTGGSGGGMTAPIPICLQACSSVADCTSAAPAYDADNYACTAGACRYLGCNSDMECAASGLVCREQFGLDTCVLPCSTPSDCDIGGGPSYDADNYQCVMGGCLYQGCNDNAECAANPGGYNTCWDTGAGLKVCSRSCNVPADCVDPNAQAPYDADNYACNGGICQYTGCNSNAECAALGNFICATP